MSKRDLGMRVVALANEVTPDQVAEMLAVRLANMHETQCPTHVSHWRPEGVYAPLVKRKMIVGQRVPDWPRGWKKALLTNTGERVLLHIAERAMVAQGVVATLDPPSWAGE